MFLLKIISDVKRVKGKRFAFTFPGPSRPVGRQGANTRRSAFIFRFVVVCALVIQAASPLFLSRVLADTGTFNSTADAYLSSGSPNANNSTNVIMDLTNTRDGVVRFDTSFIPSGSTITSATLTLAATAVGSVTSIKNYGAHRILVDWTESTVTWNTPGSTAGTHFAASPTDTIVVSVVGSYSWNVTSDVASFVAGSAINYGWRIIWSSNTSGTNKQVDFGAKENATASNWPVLSVTYTTPDTTAPSAVSSLALSSPSNSAITLSWTALGDDGSTGTATSYDIRYSTANITEGNWSSATQASGEPSPLVAGSSQSMTITGLSPSTTYYFAIKTSDEVPNTSAISNVPSLATLASGGGGTETSSSSGVGAAVLPTRVIISGQAYPGASVELLRKSIQDEIYRNTPETISTISADGTFLMQLTALLQGQYLFALRIEDKDGRKTGNISFNVDLTSANELVARDLFVPPTLSFEKTVVSLGKGIKAMGYAAPKSTIEIEIDGILKEEAKSDTNGFWSYATGTAPFRIGNHYIRARQMSANGKTSEFSPSHAFRVSLLVSPKSDFNNDDRITIADWSIFLFRWGSKDMALREKIDMNGDEKIDISDLSIFLKTLKTL